MSAGAMHHLAEDGLKAYSRPSGKKPKASRDLSSSSTRKGDVGGKSEQETGQGSFASTFSTRAASAQGFGGFKAFQKYGVGVGLTPASIRQRGDASTQNYWLRRLGLVQNRMGATLAQREDPAKAQTNSVDAAWVPTTVEEAIAEEATGAPAATKAAGQCRSRRRHSRVLASHCLSPRAKSKGECAAGRGGAETQATDTAVMASKARRRHLMAQLTGEEVDALLMREVLMQAHGARVRASSSRAPSTRSAQSDGSFEWCGGSKTPSICSTSSHLAAGISVVSVSSQAHSYESDGGDGRSCESGSASGSSWSLLSALQLEPRQCGDTGTCKARAAEHERYSAVLLMSDGESADS